MFKIAIAVAPFFALSTAAMGETQGSQLAHEHAAPNGQVHIHESEIVPCVQHFVPSEEGARDAFRLQIWPDGIIPYEFNANVSATNQARAINAMNEIMEVCGAEFVERTTEFDRIVFVDSNVNSSFVGRSGGPQNVNIANWNIRFIIVHELLHALGSYHEQSRPDRDDFVEINVANIEPDALFNFQIAPLAAPVGDYDFDSVMHYGQFDFSTNGMRTITVLPPNEAQQAQIGQRVRLSDGDILGLTTRYGSALTTDLDGDGNVNSVDLAVLIAAWGTPGADFNGDGTTDATDLAVLLAAWTG